jgi:hypothetical protein
LHGNVRYWLLEIWMLLGCLWGELLCYWKLFDMVLSLSTEIFVLHN